PLLPAARLGPRRRGPGAGDLSAGLAWLRPVRGPVLGAPVAVHHRHPDLPERAADPSPPAAAVRPGGPGGRPPGGRARPRPFGTLAGTGPGRAARTGPRGRRDQPGRGAAGLHRRAAVPA